jgi:hypothetical protein
VTYGRFSETWRTYKFYDSYWVEEITPNNNIVVGSTYLGTTFDGMGAVVLVNTRTYFRMPAAGGINAWSIVAEGTSPTCTLDIWKIANGTALPTVANTITASAKPELTTGNAVKSTTLTGWTTNFSLDDIFCVNVDACSAATKISLVLYI